MSSIIKVNTFQDANGNALFSSDGSGNVTTSASGLQNTPAFMARASASQSIANTTYVKITLDIEDFDTNSAFDNSTNYRFTVPSGEGGKYYIGYVLGTGATFNDQNRIIGKIYKNGSGQNFTVANDWTSGSNIDMIINNAVTMNLSAGDYLELYMYHNSGGGTQADNAYTRFYGYKLIGA